MKSVKILLLVAAVWSGLNFAFAQTWTQTSTPNEEYVSVASSADGSRLVALGIYPANLICSSTNSGAAWITNTMPLETDYGGWSSIASSADGTKLVGTEFNVIWVSTNAGITWSSNDVAGGLFFRSAAISADGSELVAVAGLNSPGPIYTSTNSGASWTQTTAPTNLWTSVASSADGSKLVAVAESGTTYLTNGNVIYTSTDAGLTWTLTGAPTNNTWVTVASSADGSKIVAASQFAYVPSPGNGGIYTSTDSGMTWTSNNVTKTRWQSVAPSADGSKLVAVADVGQGGWIYTSTNSGATWASNNAPNYSWTSVASSADGNKLIAAPAGDQSSRPAPIYISQTTPTPQLNITPSNTNLALSWIIPSTNFVLQQSSDLISWANLTNTPALNLTNLQNQVMLSPSNSSAFYRLKTP